MRRDVHGSRDVTLLSDEPGWERALYLFLEVNYLGLSHFPLYIIAHEISK